jgi:hypothetical protein
MPFFFGDSRSVFYGTSTVGWQTISESPGFGLALPPAATSATRAAGASIPAMVFQPGPRQPDAPVEITAGSMLNTSAARGAVTAAGLRAVIGRDFTVTFHGRPIGATGSVAANHNATTTDRGQS